MNEGGNCLICSSKLKVLKKVLPTLLLGIFVLQLFSSVGYVAWFKMNQKTIADLFCINKKNPTMHCDGKCFMMKGLHQEEEKQSHSKGIVKSEISELFVETKTISIIHVTNSYITLLNLNKHQKELSGFLSMIDQPPC
jgi:hypothetical protein